MNSKNRAVKFNYCLDRIKRYQEIVENNDLEVGVKQIQSGVISYNDGENCIIQLDEKNIDTHNWSTSYISVNADENGNSILNCATQISNYKGVYDYASFEADLCEEIIYYHTSNEAEIEYKDFFNKTLGIIKSTTEEDVQ